MVSISACASSAADMMLMSAIKSDNYKEAKYWLEHGANPNYISCDNELALYEAMTIDFNRHHNLEKFDNSVALTELLLSHGADPNGNISLLPLVDAVMKLGDYRLCNVLLKYGADPKKVERYREIRLNAIDYAKNKGYTRVAQLLENPKSYSEKYTVTELNYLVKISLNQGEYDKTIKYCKQYYSQLTQELSSNYDGWLTKGHIQFYEASALLQKSIQSLNRNDYAESERLLLEAIAVDKERKANGDTQDIGVDLEKNLAMVRNWMSPNPASVLDDLDFLLKQGRKDATVVCYLLAAADYLQQISDFEGSYELVSIAYSWLKDEQLKNSLGDTLFMSTVIQAAECYPSSKTPIMSASEMEVYGREMRQRFGEKSVEYLSYELATSVTLGYMGKYSDSKRKLQGIAQVTEPIISNSKLDQQKRSEYMRLYVSSKSIMASVYEIGEDNKEAAYNELKLILTDTKYSPYVEYASQYEDWIGLCYEMKRFDDIWSVVPKYFSLSHEKTMNALTALSEEDMLFWYGSSHPFFYDSWIVLATNYSKKVPQTVIEEIYNNELFKKGLLLRSIDRMKEFVNNSKDSTIVHINRKLQANKIQLLQLQSSSKADLATISKLKEAINRNERLLAAQSSEFRKYQNESNIDWKQIKNSLKTGEVAIEFMNYGAVDQYFAIVLRNDWRAPKLIQLPKMILYSQEDKDFQNKMYVDYAESVGLYDLEPHFLKVDGDAGEVYAYGGNGTDLYEAIWKPLLPYVNNGDRIYFAPSGALLQLAVEALPVNESKRLMDEYNMIRVSSTRELATTKHSSLKKNAALFGGITYSVNDMKVFEQESRKYPTPASGVTRSADYGFSQSYKPLPYLLGSLKEVNDISNLMKRYKFSVSTHTMTAANEESMKAQSGRSASIIHIATHGFYWDNEKASMEPYIAQTGSSTQYIDPLTRCGLYMAGADVARSGHVRDLPIGCQDGVLTAKEISLMDLRGCDLVVLSACETAKGDITSEGVFGLQRAFKMAGVQTIIMSLWPVNDAATQMLMTEFYTNWIERKQSKREAFKNAQNAVRYAVDKDGDRMYENPKYWAGFIMLD